MLELQTEIAGSRFTGFKGKMWRERRVLTCLRQKTHTKVYLSVCSQNRERPKHTKPIYSDSVVRRQMFEARVTSACLSGEILSGPLKIQILKKRE